MKTSISIAAVALSTALAATSAFAADIQVSGKVFADYSTSTATGNPAKTGTTLSRTYLSVKKKIDDTWSVKLTLDSAYDAATAKHNNVFLKKAQMTGKFSDEVNVKFGMISTPWIGYEDKLGKHRHVSKSFADTHKLGSSADAGMGVFGSVLDGMLSYDVVSINGGGYGNTVITEKSDIELRVGVQPIEGLTLDVGYRNGYKGAFVANTTENKNTLTQIMVTYGAKIDGLSYRAGLNMISNDVKNELPTGTTVNEKGTEIWAWARKGEFGGFMRSESWDNDSTGAATEKRTVFGADYYPAKGLIVSLVFDSTTDVKGVAGDDKSKTGLFTQFKF
ncbi:MAG: hypothetical protein Q9M19_00120 [Mariprofundaceae bacterium]|nr:hypothetical protein [Mariprofundaceae bacterium]